MEMGLLAIILCFSQFLHSAAKDAKCCRLPHPLALDCSGCGLRHLPHFKFLRQYSNITSMNLNDNSITHVDDFAFTDLKHLQHLSVRNNRLTSLDNSTFAGLCNLETLDVFQKDGYVISKEVFRPLTALRSLRVGNMCPINPCEFPNQAFFHVAPSLHFLELLLPPNFEFGNEFAHLRQLETLVVYGHGCSLRHISNRTFQIFSNSLQTLEIHDCQVNSLSEDSFTAFQKLETLNFACNRNMSLPQIFEAVKRLPSASLTTLITDGVHSGSVFNELKGEWFKSPKLKNLRRLSLRQTNIISVDLDVAFHLPNLEFLNLGYNTIIAAKHQNIRMLLEFIDKQNVTSVDLSFMGQPVGSHSEFRKKYCREADIHSDDFFRKPPTYIIVPDPVPCCNHSLIGGNLVEMLRHNIPQSLLFFYLNTLGFPSSEIHKASFNDDNNILFIDFSGIRIRSAYGPIYGLSKLQGIDGSQCGLQYVAPHLLDSFPSLTFFNVSGNELNEVQWDRLFKNTLKMRILDLSSNRLSSIPEDIFTSLAFLEVALLNNNPLGRVFINLKNNNNLTVLDMRNTSLLPSLRLMREIDELQSRIHHTFELRLQGNIFQCDCNNLVFLKWLKKTTLNVGKENLRCYYMKKLRVIFEVDLADLEYNCGGTMHVVTTVLTSLASVVAVLLLFVIMHNHRWSLKWRFYLLCRKMRYMRIDDSVLVDETSRYHAFVSYHHDDDYEWVHDTLLPRVEREWGLELCIGQRNFVAGIPIAENICNAIDNSRYIILVITQSFVSSEWCDFEMHMALVKGRRHLVIIYKEEVDVDKMSKTLRSLMGSLNYIEYSENQAGNALFWTRLRDKLASHITT